MASAFERHIDRMSDDRNNVYDEPDAEPDYEAIMEHVGIVIAGHRGNGVRVTVDDDFGLYGDQVTVTVTFRGTEEALLAMKVR